MPPVRQGSQSGEYVVMVLGKARSGRRDAGAKACRRAVQVAVPALLFGLAACSPIETYRDLTGISRNDPNPATTPNTQNLAAGEKSPYPNLATVPPPPSQALTSAELDKLTQSLIADRKNARYTTEKLQAGFDEGAGPPPPPPPAPPAAAPRRLFRCRPPGRRRLPAGRNQPARRRLPERRRRQVRLPARRWRRRRPGRSSPASRPNRGRWNRVCNHLRSRPCRSRSTARRRRLRQS